MTRCAAGDRRAHPQWRSSPPSSAPRPSRPASGGWWSASPAVSTRRPSPSSRRARSAPTTCWPSGCPTAARRRDSEADAMRVVTALGCRTERVDITPMVEPMLALISGDDEATLRVRRGNVMARQRMIVLYDRSAAFDALVVGTSNKTEALLGYGTLHGDMAARWRRSATSTRASCAPWPPPWACRRRSWPSHHRPTCGRTRPMRPSWVPAMTTWTGSSSRSSTGAGAWNAAWRRGWTPIWSPGWPRASRATSSSARRRRSPRSACARPGIDHLYPRRRPGSRRGS